MPISLYDIDQAELKLLIARRRVASSYEGPPSFFDGVRFAERVLAARRASPDTTPDCTRCQGSGEDPEGFHDQSRGPDGATHDGPCRDCGGTGARPAAQPAQAGADRAGG